MKNGERVLRGIVIEELAKSLGREPTPIEVATQCKLLGEWAYKKARELGIKAPLPTVKKDKELV